MTDCKCGDKQEQARQHVANCGECSHDEDGDINPCEEFQRTFMSDCGGRKDRSCAVSRDGAFEHYDIKRIDAEKINREINDVEF